MQLLVVGLEDGSAVAPGQNTTKEEALSWLEKQKSVKWSEDDEWMLNEAINAVIVSDYAEGRKERCIDWLKSLKDRYTWKPSDEHYELEEFAKIVRGNFTDISKDVQALFENKYLKLTGKKMYGGYKD